jgi:hypothetical protein
LIMSARMVGRDTPIRSRMSLSDDDQYEAHRKSDSPVGSVTGGEKDHRSWDRAVGRLNERVWGTANMTDLRTDHDSDQPAASGDPGTFHVRKLTN